ncbi:MAG: porin [Marinilabiliaceae bacterium]
MLLNFRNVLLPGVILLCTFVNARSQNDADDFEPSGSVYGTLFSNFNTSLSGPDPQTAFEVRRAYLGYEYFISPEFSAEVKLDIGSPDDASQYSLLRRFGYFKNAALYYQPTSNIEIGFGLQDAIQFKVQEKFWNRRYIAKSFMDEYKFGPSADIGIKGAWTSENVDVDVAFFNGEGYSSLQNDNTFKGGAGITYRPLKKLTTRIYSDFSVKSIEQSTTTIFAGYRHDSFSVGGEYALHRNRKFQEDHNVYGFSVMGDINIAPDLCVFGRYDQVDSNILEGESVPWNLANDESAIIAGVEYTPVEAIKIAANYQDHYPAAKNAEMRSAFFINVKASF